MRYQQKIDELDALWPAELEAEVAKSVAPKPAYGTDKLTADDLKGLVVTPTDKPWFVRYYFPFTSTRLRDTLRLMSGVFWDKEHGCYQVDIQIHEAIQKGEI